MAGRSGSPSAGPAKVAGGLRPRVRRIAPAAPSRGWPGPGGRGAAYRWTGPTSAGTSGGSCPGRLMWPAALA